MVLQESTVTNREKGEKVIAPWFPKGWTELILEGKKSDTARWRCRAVWSGQVAGS
jgi:hypothetical protein